MKRIRCVNVEQRCVTVIRIQTGARHKTRTSKDLTKIIQTLGSDVSGGGYSVWKFVCLPHSCGKQLSLSNTASRLFHKQLTVNTSDYYKKETEIHFFMLLSMI